MQNELLAPKYAREFMCTGPKCPDNCCHENWSITIDPATYRLYTSHPELGQLMKSHLTINRNLDTKEQTPAYIKQKPGGGCGLQENNGLCSVHKKFGANALCYTCAVYPRRYMPLGQEQVLSMNESCPEVARKLVEDPRAMELDMANMDTWDRLILRNNTQFDENYKRRYQLLQGLLTLLRYRDISLEMRIFIATLLIQRADRLLVEGDESEISMDDLLNLYSKLVNEHYFDKQVLLLRETAMGGLPLVILESLLDMHHTDSLFVRELEKTLTGLLITKKADINEAALQRLNAAHHNYLAPLEKQNPWMLENILVNWLLFDLFPVNKKNLNDGWLKITTRYLLLRTLLSGIGAAQQALTIKDVTHLVYQFGRRISSSDKLSKLQLELVGRNLHQPAALLHALKL